MKIVKTFFLTLWIYGLLGWVYIVLNSEIHPQSLPWPLTHFASWPREDTFGEISFAISFISFFIWNIIKKPRDNNN